MKTLSASSGSLLLLIVALLVTAGLQVYLWPHVTDDAYISFRYAYHLASGEGLVFNPGEHVEGFSNPLWTLLLAGVFFLTHIPLPDLARGIGFLCTAGVLIVTWHIFRRHFSTAGPGPLGLAFLALVLSPGFHVYATAGLEGPLLSFLILFGSALSLRSSKSASLTAALLFGLVGISRPEGPLYAFLWILATTGTDHSLVRLVKTELPRMMVVALPILGWQIFRVIYFGAWIPNTGVAKVPGVFGEFIGFPDYITPWIIAVGGPVVLLAWFLIPPPDGTMRRLERQCLAIVGTTAIFVAYARGDWMPFGRFIAPVWPLVAIVFSLWLDAGFRSLASARELRWKKTLVFVPAAAIILSAYFAWRPSVEDYVGNRKMNMLMRGTDQIEVGNWIDKNIAHGATIATGRLGGISYGGMNTIVWDWFGLTDAEEARYIRRGRPGTLEDDPVFQRKPDVIAAIDAPADWGYKRTVQLMRYLQNHYQFVLGFPQGTYGYVDIWIRRDRMNDVFLTQRNFVLPQ